MDEAVEATILQALINANISRNLKAKVNEILKSSTDINYQIENLSKILHQGYFKNFYATTY